MKAGGSTKFCLLVANKIVGVQSYLKWQSKLEDVEKKQVAETNQNKTPQISMYFHSMLTNVYNHKIIDVIYIYKQPSECNYILHTPTRFPTWPSVRKKKKKKQASNFYNGLFHKYPPINMAIVSNLIFISTPPPLKNLQQQPQTNQPSSHPSPSSPYHPWEDPGSPGRTALSSSEALRPKSEGKTWKKRPAWKKATHGAEWKTIDDLGGKWYCWWVQKSGYITSWGW